MDIPYGIWYIKNDVLYWKPNTLLSLTEDEQREHNEKQGHTCLKEK